MQIDSLTLHKVSVGLELLFLQLLWLLFFAFAPDLQLSLNTHTYKHTPDTHTCSSPWEPADSNKTLRRHLKNAFWILNFRGWWAQKMSSHVVFFFKSLGTQKYSPGFEWVCIFNRSILQIQFLLNYIRPQKLCVSNLLLKNPKKFHSVGSIEALLPCKRFFHSAVLPLTGYDIKKTKKTKRGETVNLPRWMKWWMVEQQK